MILKTYLVFVDIAIPVSNKRGKLLLLVYWLLARQMGLRERGTIPEDGDLDIEATDFELKF